MPEMNIEASGFSNMITIQLLNSGKNKHNESQEDCLNTLSQLEALYRGRVIITYKKHTYGCSVVIRSNSQKGMNDTYIETRAVDTEKPVTD
jgi:hypothetical protein